MARPRSALNARLPVNLSLHATGVFRYVHPITKRHHYVGNDRAVAIQTANAANAKLIPRTSHLEKILNNRHRLVEAIDLFEKEGIPARNWKPKTLKDYMWYLGRIRADIGARDVESIQVKDCAEYLRKVTESLRARKQYRSILVWVLDGAVTEGWIAQNPASHTKVAKAKRQRPRLTVEDFEALHEMAEPWLQRAMEIGLYTALRRGDVVNLRFDAIRDGYLFVIPEKTEDSSNHRLKFLLHGGLAETVDRCRDQNPSPFLIHSIPKRLPPKSKQGGLRQHHMQVTPEQLTRSFAALVKKSGRWPEKGANPCFHELRSLASDMARKAGYTIDQMQSWMGHASEDMTKEYLKGHDAPWTDVEVSFELPLGRTASARQQSARVDQWQPQSTKLDVN